MCACEEGIFSASEDSATHLCLLFLGIFTGLWLPCGNALKCLWLLECYTESIHEPRSSFCLVQENMFLGLQPCCRLSASLCQPGDLGMH